MIQAKRGKLSTAQRADMEPLKAGQSLHEIGRALGKDHVIMGGLQGTTERDTAHLAPKSTNLLGHLRGRKFRSNPKGFDCIVF
jgi:hypothetical protein